MGKQSMGVGGNLPDAVKLKVVPNTNRKYWAGTDGHIYCYSDARVNARKPKPFRVGETLGSSGYFFIAVIIAGYRQSKAVHTLVCLSYHGQKPSPVQPCPGCQRPDRQ